MRKIYSFFFTSLDGFHETRDRDIDWQDVDDEFDDFDLAQLDEAGTILLGRVTYEGFAEFWSSGAAEKADPVRTKLLNALPKVVVSRTLQNADWQNTTIIGSDTDAQIRALKHQAGKDIEVLGSAKLTAYLIEAGLLDELRVMVCPVVLGGGNPGFPWAGQVDLELLGSRRFGNGNVLLTYRPLARTAEDGS